MEYCPPLKTCGVWIRPNKEEHSCAYEKLLATGFPDFNQVTWATVRTDQFDEDQPTHVLQYSRKDRFWCMQEAIACLGIDAFNDNQNASKRMFMHAGVKSFIEPLETRDLLWSKLDGIEDIFEPAKPADGIVWRVQKMWSHDTRYATSITKQSEIWLDMLEVLSDGSCKWSCSDGSYVLRRTSTSGQPYETVHWTMFLPSMFDFPTEALALHNAEDLLVSYVDNNPLEVKYVYMQAFSKKEYEMSKLAEELGCCYP